MEPNGTRKAQSLYSKSNFTSKHDGILNNYTNKIKNSIDRKLFLPEQDSMISVTSTYTDDPGKHCVWSFKGERRFLTYKRRLK